MAVVTISDPTEELGVAWDDVRAELRAFIARRVSDPQAVEDLVQDVLVRLLATASSRVEIHNPSAWLHRVARNAVIDHYRSRRPQETLGGTAALPDPSSWPGTEDHGDRSPARELARCLRPLVDRLPPAYRDALVLTDLDGMTQSAAAAALNLSVSGMKSRVQRARLQLRALLVDCCPVEIDRRGAVIDYVRPPQGCEAAGCSARLDASPDPQAREVWSRRAVPAVAGREESRMELWNPGSGGHSSEARSTGPTARPS